MSNVIHVVINTRASDDARSKLRFDKNMMMRVLFQTGLLSLVHLLVEVLL